LARIFIVDDSREVRFLLRTVLELEGHEVYEAEDGVEALALPAGPDDIVLLDVMMPRMTGTEYMSELRKRKRPLPRIIVLTAKAGDDDRRHALELGAVAYLTKPFDTEDVLAEVKRVMSQWGIR
jgi:two-component system response regulator CpxR